MRCPWRRIAERSAMPDLRTTFVGLELDCPIVVGSAGITETVDRTTGRRPSS